MKQILKNKRGESILETVIAMTILAIGIAFSSAIIGSSLVNVNTSKNRIIAVNIAREGIEAMRNIRDTNWLKFTTNRRQCWNNDPIENTCDGSNAILPGHYTIYKENSAQKWVLEDQLIFDNDGDEFPIEPNNDDVFRRSGEERTYIWDANEAKWIDKATLSLVDINPLVDTNLDHDYINDTDLYNHVLVGNPSYYGTEVKRTIFKRYIKIEYIDNNGTLITDPGNLTAEHNRMRITATVVWRSSKKEHKTVLSTHITDYLGRERLGG